MPNRIKIGPKLPLGLVQIMGDAVSNQEVELLNRDRHTEFPGRLNAIGGLVMLIR
jgi:hypothetical protein